MSAETTLGSYLRHCRERAGLTVEAVSSGSRVVPQLIRALEADRHDLLPAPVYVRGFIRAYCEQVGADAEAALQRYEARVAASPAPSLRPLPTAPASSPAPPAWRWNPIVIAAALLVGLGLGVAFLAGRDEKPPAVASRSPAPVTRSVASPAPAAAVTTSPATVSSASSPGAPVSSVGTSPSATAAPSSAVPAGHVLLVRAVDTVWVRVTPEGGPASEETLQPGAVREWRSTGRFRLSAGNAGGLELQLDGRPLPALGERGQVVHATIPGEPTP